MSTSDKQAASKVEVVELAVARLLRVGVVISAILTTGGLGWLLAAPGSAQAAWLVQAGLLALILTPILRVAAALIIFVRERDYTYALFSFIVLSVLALGVLLGRAGH